MRIETREQWLDGYSRYIDHIEHDVSRNVSVGDYISAPSATELFVSALDILGRPGDIHWDYSISDRDNLAHIKTLLRR